MAKIPLPPDFKEFLKLLNENKVKYLLIGGYAVNYYGYVRATADLDIWILQQKENVKQVIKVLKDFGFDVPELTTDIFFQERKVVRMGEPPMRIEIHTSISGVEFQDCYPECVIADWDDLTVPIIGFDKLKENKRVSGRLKDEIDLEHLE